MLPRLRPGSQRRTSFTSTAHDRGPVFSERPAARKLRVVVDDAALPSESGPADDDWSLVGLLAGLLTHESIEVFRFSDHGPPPTVARREAPLRSGEFVDGWIVLGDVHPAAQVQAVYWIEGDAYVGGAIQGNAPDVAEQDTRAEVYGNLEPEAAARLRRESAIAAEAADTVRADILITNRDYLHAIEWSLGRDVTFLRPPDALSFISLFLRDQGEYFYWKTPRSSFRLDKAMFYWTGARELTPSGWRWFSACVKHSKAVGSDRLLLVGQTALQRIQRALELRDAVHLALNRPPGNNAADDALLAFDSCAIYLMGALDAVARVANEALLPGTRPKDAAWQRAGWLERIRERNAGLADVVGAGTQGAATLNILKILRNTVHSAGLTSVALVTSRVRGERTMLNLSAGLDAEETSVVLTAMDALGGQAAWGVEEFSPGEYLVDPGLLLEKLVPPALRLVDSLMARTPVETLTGVSLTDADRRPADEGPLSAFSARNRESVRWQLGLDTGVG